MRSSSVFLLAALLPSVDCANAGTGEPHTAGQIDFMAQASPALPALAKTAEKEGTGFPRDSVLRPYPPYPLPGNTKVVGDSSRKCVEVPAEPNIQVRSGEFIAGGYLTQLVFGRPLKLWWRPVNSAREMTLLVRARRVDAPYDTVRFVTSEISAPLDSDTHEPVVEEGAFPPGIAVTAPGTWLMVATSNRNWGCFVVTIRPPKVEPAKNAPVG